MRSDSIPNFLHESFERLRRNSFTFAVIGQKSISENAAAPAPAVSVRIARRDFRMKIMTEMGLFLLSGREYYTHRLKASLAVAS